MADVNLLGTIDSLNSQLKVAEKAVIDGQAGVDYAQGQVNEYYRQIHYHLDRGDQQNANNVEPTYLTWVGNLENSKKALAEKQKRYDQIAAELKTAMASLTQAQKDEITLQQNIAIRDAATKGAIADSAAATAKKVLVAQGTTKYLIIGAIVLTVIVIFGIVIYKRSA